MNILIITLLATFVNCAPLGKLSRYTFRELFLIQKGNKFLNCNFSIPQTMMRWN